MEWKSVHAPVYGGEETSLESRKARLTAKKHVEAERLGLESIHAPTPAGSEPKNPQTAIGNDCRVEEEEATSQSAKTPLNGGIRLERVDAVAGSDGGEVVAEKEALS